jgi:hypothetical protein
MAQSLLSGFLQGYAQETTSIMQGKREAQAKMDEERQKTFDQTQMYMDQLQKQADLQRETYQTERPAKLEDYTNEQAVLHANKMEEEKLKLTAEKGKAGADAATLYSRAEQIRQQMGWTPEQLTKALQLEGGDLTKLEDSALNKNRYGATKPIPGVPYRKGDEDLKREAASLNLDKGYQDSITTPSQNEVKPGNSAMIKTSAIYPGIDLTTDGVEQRFNSANQLGDAVYQRYRNQYPKLPQADIRDEAKKTAYDLLKVISPAPGVAMADKDASSPVKDGQLNPNFKGQFSDDVRMESAAKMAGQIQKGDIRQGELTDDQFKVVQLLSHAYLAQHQRDNAPASASSGTPDTTAPSALPPSVPASAPAPASAAPPAPASPTPDAQSSPFYGNPPANAVATLRMNPSTRAIFEKRYGVSADQYLQTKP